VEGLNIEAYDADSLRKMVRLLEYENKILKDKLKKAGISYEEVNPFEEKIESAEEYDLDQGNRIVNPPYITEKMAIRFFSMFWGREDVYARRGKNGGYFPQCANRWNDRLCPKQRKEKVLCDECENTKWISLDVKKIIDHLLGTKEDGSDVIGVYPLLPNGTCRFIVFDFDNHEKGAEVTDFANTDNEWHKEVDALRKMCELNGIRPLVERSRSGKGAHVWIFFKKAIPAATARNFGFLLLDKGSTFINLKSFHYYDRMYPSQDVASSIGNLIALPLQGQALKNGNSAFVDENWNAYPDQWDALFNKTRKLGIEDVEQCMAKWQGELAEVRGTLTNIEKNVRPKPWKKKCEFCKSDVVGKLHMVLGNGVYVDTLNLMPRIQNQIRSLAAFDNPEFYKNKRLGYSNYYNFSAVYLGKDNYVNQLEMDVWSLDPNDFKGMVREKGEFMLGLCEQCIGDSLNSRQKSIIDRCVRKLYIDIARSKEKYIPVMSDFYDILMAQPEDEAKDIALSLELFVNGSLNIFNHQTNVDVDNRFTVYGIRDLGTELSPITMLVMMESIQNRIVENGKRGKATWLYIDEFHVLLNSEYSAKYLQQLWKKVRKQGGLCTGITQNVVDLLQNYTATTMLANSEFVALLKQANTDSSKMAEVIGVSEAQLRFVTNTASGMGLIKCGSVVIPFDNQISKDTDLYRLYNTNIHEKIAEQKKKEAMLQ